MSNPAPLNVLIVDDTVVYRHILREVVMALPNCTVAATAADGESALQRIVRGGIDLVLLDVEMPVLNGLETLRRIRKEHPGVAVIMVSGANRNAAATTIEALQNGALEFVPKPEGSDPARSREILTAQLRRHIEMLQSQPAAQSAKPAAAPSPAPATKTIVPAPRNIAPVELVVIGVSTGGPNALHEVVPRLPANFPVPVMIVQHMPPLFTASLANSLDKQSALRVNEAVEGETAEPGKVYIAPGGKHMFIRKNAARFTIGLNEDPPENNCRPAVDVLFRSAAAHAGANTLSVIMTGMGNDGCNGVRAIRRQGGLCIAQDEATSVVYGMPRAVAEAGLADEVVPLSRLAPRLAALTCNA